jgi:hypothetical protein
LSDREIGGHPAIDAHRSNAPALKITVCANCESVRTILFLSGDRWFCTACRESGDARPTQIPVTNPARRR